MDFIIRLAEEFFKKHKRLARYRRIFAFLAAVVVFATTYELILPAITMDRQRAVQSPGVEVGVAKDQRKGIDFMEDESLAVDTAGEDSFDAGFPEDGDYYEDNADSAGDGYVEDYSSEETGSADDWIQPEDPATGDTWNNASEIVPGAENTGDDYSGSDGSGTWTDENEIGTDAADNTGASGDEITDGSSSEAGEGVTGTDTSGTENGEADPEVPDAADGTGLDGTGFDGTGLEEGEDGENGLEDSGSAPDADGQDPETVDGEGLEGTPDASVDSTEKNSGDALGNNTQDASTGISASGDKSDKGSTASAGTAENSGEAVIEGSTAETAVEFAAGGAAVGATDLTALGATGDQAAAAVTYPATIIYEGKDYTITATFDEKAKLPAEVTLSAVEILPNKVYKDENGNPLYADYEEYYEKTLEALEKESRLENDQAVKSARFFDITFLDKDGNTVEPAASVSIAVKYKDALSAADTADTMAVHFEDTAKADNTEKTEKKDKEDNDLVEIAIPEIAVPEILDTKTEVKKKAIQEISFEAENFSVYGVIGTEVIEKEVVTASGNTLRVTVEVTDVNDMDRLEDLRVNELTTGSDKYLDAYDAVVAVKKAEDENFDEDRLGFFASDIELLDANGEVFEPEGSVTVKIELISPLADEETLISTMEIQHLADKNGEIDVQTVATSDDIEKIDDVITAEFSVDSFSTFTLTWTGDGSSQGIPEDQATTLLNIMDGNDAYATVSVRFVDVFGHNIESPFNDSDVDGQTPVTIADLLNNVDIEGYEYQGAYYDSYTSSDEHGDAITTITATRTSEEQEGNPYQSAGQVNNGTPVGNWRNPNTDYYRLVNGQYVRIWWNRRGGGGVNANNYYFYNNENGSGNSGRFTGTAYYYAGSSTTTYYRTTVEALNGETSVDTLTSEPTTSTDSFATGKSIYLVYKSTNDDKKKATIHWGTYVGDEFVELKTPVALDASASSMKLDVIIGPEAIETSNGNLGGNGWYYVGAEYQVTGGEKQNLSNTSLYKSNDVWQVKIENQSKPVNIEDGSHIYVNYAPKGDGSYTPPTPKPDDKLGPDTNKHVTNNGDGTFTVQLDVEGHEDHSTVQRGANVIIVMDITQSMTNNMPDGGSRMAAAKKALNTLITTLDPDTNIINFTAVNFGNSANYSNGVAWTNEKSSMTSYVTGLPNSPTDLGTCWEAGLQGGIDRVNQARENDNLKNNETYVLFVTDGNPNGWVDESGRYQQQTAGLFVQAAYDAAVPKANTLAGLCHFYGIFCGDADGYTHLNALITEAHGEAVINGDTTTAIESAFEDIATTIVNNLGAGSVVVDDGVPTLASVNASVVSGEAGGFEYFITPKNGTQTTWENAPGASYSNSNGVTWNLSEAGTLKDGWIYTLKFTVWPSQAAYDLIADLNNGLVEFDDLTQEQQDSIDGNIEDGYTMKTNSHLYTTFKDLEGHEYIDDKIKYESDDMDLPTEKITIKKIWNNPIDDHIGDEDDEPGVRLILTKDGEDYLSGEHAIIVAPENEEDMVWESEKEIYISCGNISQNTTTHEYIVHEDGHDYAITEPESFSYYWDLTGDIYHPMVINGVATYLLQNDKASGVDGVDYYIINGHKYVKKEGGGSQELTATNDRRSSLNVFKAIDDQSEDRSADMDTLFEYKVTVKKCYEDVYFDALAGSDFQEIQGSGITKEMENGNWTGWYMAQANDEGVTTFTMKVKSGWSVYFANLPKGAEYTIQEINLPEGWSFETAESSALKYLKPTETESETYDVNVNNESATVEGTIVNSNRLYSVTLSNKWEPSGPELNVNKVWASGQFVTTHGDVTVALFKDSNGDGEITADEYIDGSERTIASGSSSVTYEKLSSLDGLVVREVTVSTETTGEGEEAVTTKTVTPTAPAPNNVIAVSGETTTGGSNISNIYVVTYSQGTTSGTTRTDTVTNTLIMTKVEITKIGDWTAENKLGNVQFKLFSDEECTSQIISDSNGVAVGTNGVISTGEEGSQLGKALVGTFVPGTYFLKEIKSADGYNLVTDAISFTINGDGTVTYSTGNNDFDSEDGATYSTNDGIGIYINNPSGAELPYTGGPGTFIYTLSGITLLMAAALMYIFRMRRRERRVR